MIKSLGANLVQRSHRFMPFAAACLAGLLLSAAAAEANAQQVLSGHVPHAVANSRAVNRLADTTRLDLAIGLPLRNQNELDALLVQLQDPASPKFGHYLSAQQFAAEFGPTERDYQALILFAHENGLVVTGTHPNRLLLDVSGETSAIEKALHVKMTAYDHPVRGRFYAPDREPSLDLEVEVLDISGLDNYTLPQPMGLEKIALEKADPYVTGTGPGGYFIGKDFRAAYAPGVTLTGSGEVVSVNLLATGVNGSQVAQVFKVTYTDGTSSILTQNLSDWFTPQSFSGETKAMTMLYRDNGQGQRDNRTLYLYEYKFVLNATKTVASITLPNNRNVVVLAATLTSATTSIR